jgi:hypothetical protein
MVSPQFLVEPCFGKAPISFHGLGGNSDNVSGFLDTEATKVAKLDDTSLPGVKQCKSVNGVVDRNQFGGARFGEEKTFVEGEFLPTGAALHTKVGTSVVDKNTAHELSGNPEEVGFVLPVHVALLCQAHESFVDKSCSLKCMVGSFPSHVVSSEPPQFIVDDRNEPGFCSRIPSLKILKQSGNVFSGRLHVDSKVMNDE